MKHYAAYLKVNEDGASTPIIVCGECLGTAQDDPKVEIDLTERPINICSDTQYCHYTHPM